MKLFDIKLFYSILLVENCICMNTNIEMLLNLPLLFIFCWCSEYVAQTSE